MINDVLRFFFQGENGFFKLVRGVNNLGIESGTCAWVHLSFFCGKLDVFIIYNFYLITGYP